MLALVSGPWAYALALVADRPAGLLAGAAVVAALLLATVIALRVRALPTPPGTRHAAALRARARSRQVPRQVDPDAPGRPRPRAPGLGLSAA
ncbi:DUF6412 domain-containing protein [Micromonospora sp. WMMD998]|uniref:DUF6412 domain-containing protein n=1 Tax=Micromonospora sp. WMMD998 TaxID=3016092 RepID=UPI00249CE375|nr:DUF6412 domain-containing protein [Micromonospora sp. WMMD998]WFE42776.1 DUF6412 domain-containing protein [Micromonospora sp. WMMD998]